jgi:serine phosphatase RsbU (regulator of sigma subunit)
MWKSLAIEAYSSPARTIGGDFRIVLPDCDDSLSTVVSNVFGHGVGSALIAIASILKHCTRLVTNPSQKRYRGAL